MQEAYENALAYVLQRDASVVYRAAKGLGTDNSLLIQALTTKTKSQIERIDHLYRELPENKKRISLYDLVKSECGGNYGKFMKYVSKTRPKFLADMLSKAMDGIGCTKSLVSDVFCLSTTEEIQAMKAVWEQKHDARLVDRLRSELSGQHENLMIYLLQNGRAEGPRDVEFSTQKAEELHSVMKSGKTMMGGLSSSAEKTVGEILAQISIDQLGDLKEVWDKKFGKDGSLKTVLAKRLSGDFETAVLMLCDNPLDACCAKLKTAMDGLGTDEDTVSFVLGGSSKVRAQEINARYFEKYDKSLVTCLESEISGNYLKAVTSYITTHDPTNGLEDVIKRGGATEETYSQAYDNVKQSIAETDAFLLKFAASGLNTDESLIIDVMCNKTKEELDALDMSFRKMFKDMTLNQFVHKSTGGNLAEFLSFVQMNENEFDSYVLHKAFKGMGCDKEMVIEIFCTRTKDRLQAARQYYESRKDANLVDRLHNELSGDLERLCLRLLTEDRHNPDFNADQIAIELYAHGEGKWGTNESGFIDIFSSNSLAQMKEVSASYEKLYNNSLLAAVKSEFSGNIKMALTYLLMDPIDVTCLLLKKATIDKLGTNEGVVNRCIGGHDKKGVKEIARRFFSKYDKSLLTVLKSELSGDYKRAVIQYIEGSGVTEDISQMNDAKSDVQSQSSVTPPAPPTQQQQQQAQHHFVQSSPQQTIPPQQNAQQFQRPPSQQQCPPQQMSYGQQVYPGQHIQQQQIHQVQHQAPPQQRPPPQQTMQQTMQQVPSQQRPPQQHYPSQQPVAMSPLLPGWEEKITPDGKKYYVDHNTHSTQWTRPV